MTDRRIAMAQDGRSVLAENGPMRMNIQAWQHDGFHGDLAVEAAGFAFTCLDQVAAHRWCLMSRDPGVVNRLERERRAHIPLNMVRSVLAFDEPDLTPMAAVAGSMADAVADWLFEKGMSRVIVDNGGDIAIRLAGSERVRVGVRSDINNPAISHVVALDGDARSHCWGVNTSGLGGRSLTRGIASAVTVFAKSSSMADAAATALANACFAEDDAIVQVPAEQVDPGTDIPGIPVTVEVGAVNPDTVLHALESSLTRAEQYVNQGLIEGALIAAGGKSVWTRCFSKTIFPDQIAKE